MGDGVVAVARESQLLESGQIPLKRGCIKAMILGHEDLLVLGGKHLPMAARLEYEPRKVREKHEIPKAMEGSRISHLKVWHFEISRKPVHVEPAVYARPTGGQKPAS